MTDATNLEGQGSVCSSQKLHSCDEVDRGTFRAGRKFGHVLFETDVDFETS